MTRLDSFVIASIPDHMQFGSYHNKSMQEAAEHCVAIGLAVMNAVDAVSPPEACISSGMGEARSTGSEVVVVDVEAAREPSKADLALLERPVSFLNLNSRALGIMDRLTIRTVGELVAVTRLKIETTRGVGETTVNEIVGKLLAHGLSLATKPARDS